jgi:hypothetical protein
MFVTPRIIVALALFVLVTLDLSAARAYPLDQYERTGIKRLKFQLDTVQGKHKGTRLAPGAQWPAADFKLRLREQGRDFELTASTPKDAALQAALEKVLKQWSWRRYNVALLDITDPTHPRLAGVNEHVSQTPGSVAKVLVAAGMLEQLRARFPNDIAAREKLLRSHLVTADDWAMSDSHDVPVVSGEALDKINNRRVKIGDVFTVWEWLDHALSASNNSAAALSWREATLMRLLGEQYPPATYDAELWKRLGKDALTKASFEVVDKPLLDAGLSPEVFKLRLYFTKGAGKYIRSQSCGATPFSLVQWLVRVEQGRMVDEWSSLELKKLMYLTRRRVRYLHTHLLDNFFALFKSGSLYRFTPEATSRTQYEGDLVNVLNSLIEVDANLPPAGAVQMMTASAVEQAKKAPAKNAAGKPYVYIVAVMSNELKRNAAMDHARLAEAVHAIVTATSDAPAALPDSPDAIKVPSFREPSEEPGDDASSDTPG